MRFITALILSCCTISVHAEIYKFVDDQGNVTYTNMPRPGAKKLQLESPGKPAAKPLETDLGAKPKSKAKSSSPVYFPKVDTSTQRRRDDMRRQLLMEELRSEERNLAAARSALGGAARQPGGDLSKLAEAVRLHEKNIEMLNKELSHIR